MREVLNIVFVWVFPAAVIAALVWLTWHRSRR